MNKYSIIIPVYNGVETIRQCIESLISQDYPKENYEIIVVDDGSMDETACIASSFPVKVITLSENKGRIVARITGANEAKYSLLLFIDSRCIAKEDLLRKIDRINYTPLIGGDYGENKEKSNFDAFFYLIRRRVYWPNYPQKKHCDELWIDKDNFDYMQKGTTLLCIEKELFLQSQPENKGKSVNDDATVLRTVSERKKMLRHSGIGVEYIQRMTWKQVLPHIFHRGLVFRDYYLEPGRRFYKLWITGCILSFLVILANIFLFKTIFKYEIALFLGLYTAMCIWLSENIRDFFICLIHLPVIGITFVAGIIWGYLFNSSPDKQPKSAELTDKR